MNADLYIMEWVEHALQQRPRSGQLGVQDDNRVPHGVTPPQLLYEVVETLFSTAHNHMV